MYPHTYRERRKPIAHDSDNPIERVKTAYDLQAVAESFGFKFKVRGKLRTARCLLPSHEDTNPSFAIYPDQRFHCFGCNMHGDVLDLVALMTNKTLSEALADLRKGRRWRTAPRTRAAATVKTFSPDTDELTRAVPLFRGRIPPGPSQNITTNLDRVGRLKTVVGSCREDGCRPVPRHWVYVHHT